MLERLDQDGSSEGDEHAGVPAEEHDRACCEDERERDTACVRALDGDREVARQRGRGQQGQDAEQCRRRVALCCERKGRGCNGSNPEQADRRDDRQQAFHFPLAPRSRPYWPTTPSCRVNGIPYPLASATASRTVSATSAMRRGRHSNMISILPMRWTATSAIVTVRRTRAITLSGETSFAREMRGLC